MLSAYDSHPQVAYGRSSHRHLALEGCGKPAAQALCEDDEGRMDSSGKRRGGRRVVRAVLLHRIPGRGRDPRIHVRDRGRCRGVRRDGLETVPQSRGRRRLFRPAAPRRHVQARARFPQSYKDALEWYRRGAEQGEAECHRLIGYMHETGQGVKISYGDAL